MQGRGAFQGKLLANLPFTPASFGLCLQRGGDPD